MMSAPHEARAALRQDAGSLAGNVGHAPWFRRSGMKIVVCASRKTRRRAFPLDANRRVSGLRWRPVDNLSSCSCEREETVSGSRRHARLAAADVVLGLDTNLTAEAAATGMVTSPAAVRVALRVRMVCV